MKHIILIGIFDESKLNSGSFSWTGQSFETIRSVFGETLETGIETSKGIAYFSTSANNSKNAYEIEIHELNYSQNSLSVKYSVIGVKDIPSVDLRNKAQRILRGLKILPSDKYLPYLSILNEEQYNRVIKPSSISEEIRILTEKNDWLGVINKFGTLEDIKNFPEAWEDEYVVSGISFATAKLSETYINLRHQFNNDAEKDKFLKLQKSYREITEALRLRCIELNPTNATYYSNLGYTHYQYVRELTHPGGRRDGNAKAEAEKALNYLNKALEINPDRTIDNYRKGQLLTEILPKMLLFSRKSVINKELIEEVNTKIKEGINAFETAIESYTKIPETSTQLKHRIFKDYIKCNYDVARSYASLIINDWDEFVFLLGLDKNIEANDSTTFIPEDLINTDKAIDFCLAAIHHDNPHPSTKSGLDSIIETASHNGIMEGVFKLYSLGKYHFQKSWILSGYGQKFNTTSDLFKTQAEHLLLAAFHFPWTQEKEKSDKSYIAERLCRLYIANKEYDKAIEILQPFLKRRVDYYIRYSLAQAFMLSGRISEARHQIKLALEDEKGNKEKWLGNFLDSIALLRNGEIKESKIELEKAIEVAATEGKHNIDTLLITQGYIAIKEGKRPESVEFFKSALTINPYRVSVQKRVNN